MAGKKQGKAYLFRRETTQRSKTSESEESTARTGKGRKSRLSGPYHFLYREEYMSTCNNKLKGNCAQNTRVDGMQRDEPGYLRTSLLSISKSQSERNLLIQSKESYSNWDRTSYAAGILVQRVLRMDAGLLFKCSCRCIGIYTTESSVPVWRHCQPARDLLLVRRSYIH